jgi:hypothetical protein
MSLCKYKNALGKPGLGVHSYRIYNIAVVDVLFTIVGAFFIKYLLPKYNYFFILLTLFALGIFMHRLFCVRTTIDKFLFPMEEELKKSPFS